MGPSVVIGVLALQGAFEEHVEMLNDLGISTRLVKLPQHLEGLSGLILPGGESTAMAKLMVRWELLEPLRNWVSSGKAIWGTCAGMILLSNNATHVKEGGQDLIRGFDGTACRNYFGAQVRSFEADLPGPPGFQTSPYHAVFIRAPALVSVGPKVEVLAKVSHASADSSNEQEVVVAAQQGNILVTSFHPELTKDTRWHSFFLEKIVKM